MHPRCPHSGTILVPALCRFGVRVCVRVPPPSCPVPSCPLPPFPLFPSTSRTTSVLLVPLWCYLHTVLVTSSCSSGTTMVRAKFFFWYYSGNQSGTKPEPKCYLSGTRVLCNWYQFGTKVVLWWYYGGTKWYQGPLSILPFFPFPPTSKPTLAPLQVPFAFSVSLCVCVCGSGTFENRGL